MKIKICLCLSICPLSSFAMLPVIDVNAISQLSNEYAQLQHIDAINSQIQNYTHNLVTDAEGHYGYGELMNSTKDLEAQQYSPDSWDDAMQGKSGHSSEEYQALWDSYHDAHKPLTQDDFEQGSTSSDAEIYQQQVAANQASGVNATYVFNEVNEELEKVHDLSNHIDQAENTKSAVDLNSRIAIELAYIQMESLKMQSVINQQLADQSAGRLHDEAAESEYQALPASSEDSL